MTDEKPEATIKVFKKGERYYATLDAETPHGPLIRSGVCVGKATCPHLAIDEILATITRLANRRGRRGRKPRDYWKSRHFAIGR